MNLRDIAAAREKSKELEGLDLREAVRLAQEEFYLLHRDADARQEFFNKCHGSKDGRFCDAKGGGNSGLFLGKRNKKETGQPEPEPEPDIDTVINTHRNFKKVSDITVTSGTVSVGDPAYYHDGFDSEKYRSKNQPNTKGVTQLQSGILLVKPPKAGTYDVAMDDEGKTVRVGFTDKATGPYKLIGDVGVDSGQITIGDPKSYQGFDYERDLLPEVLDHYHKGKGGPLKLTNGILVIPTYYGDGLYPVSAQQNEKGVIQSLRVDFE